MNLTKKADRQPSVIQRGVPPIDRFAVKIREHEVYLIQREFDIFWTLASEDGKAFRPEKLIERVWGRATSSTPERGTCTSPASVRNSADCRTLP